MPPCTTITICVSSSSSPQVYAAILPAFETHESGRVGAVEPVDLDRRLHFALLCGFGVASLGGNVEAGGGHAGAPGGDTGCEHLGWWWRVEWMVLSQWSFTMSRFVRSPGARVPR
jgi:hypothetical protein